MKTANSKKTKADALAKDNNLQITGSPALQFVPLELIETAEQIRTEFDQESIEELAGEIKARGMLQPVLLRPLPNGNFLMIAGERRLRAARFAQLDNIPALIGEVDDQTAKLMQLAENIHREELSFEDECKAICFLYTTLGSLKKVAAKVHKSVPWCSKRYAISQQELNYLARNLLSDGITEDIDLLKSFSSLCEYLNHYDGMEWANKIRKGEAGRNEIRAALKAEKERVKKQEAEDKALEGKEVSRTKVKTPPAPPPWTIDDAMEDLSEALSYTDAELSAVDLLNTWTEEQKAEIKTCLTDAVKIGAGENGFKEINDSVMAIMEGIYNRGYTDVEFMAMIEGYSGKPFEWMEFLAKLQTPREKA